MTEVPSGTRLWAEIDLSAIRHNVEVVRRQVGAGAGILAVIKANAYGHGLTNVAQAIASRVDLFGVANIAEASELNSLRRDILLLSPALPEERAAAVQLRCIATVSSAEEAAGFAGGRVNFKVDTGMGRIGCWQDEAVRELQRIASLDSVEIHSVSTHLPVPDEDPVFTAHQLQHFANLCTQFRAIVPKARFHALNSAGILAFPEHAHQLVRPGLMLYGSAYPGNYQPLLRPAMTWKTRILLVRDLGPGRTVSYGRTFLTHRAMRVASLAVGYADGFPRQVSGRNAHALIAGRRCPILGRVTMDQILADVSEVEDVHTGDEAVLMGRQGQEEILARELAEQAGTISWDIFTGIGPRVERFYLDRS